MVYTLIRIYSDLRYALQITSSKEKTNCNGEISTHRSAEIIPEEAGYDRAVRSRRNVVRGDEILLVFERQLIF